MVPAGAAGDGILLTLGTIIPLNSPGPNDVLASTCKSVTGVAVPIPT